MHEKQLTRVTRLQFTYKGQKSTLRSAAEIASWIEERRKRFPTKERIAEKAQRARQRAEELEAAKRERESTARRNAEAKEKEKADAKARRKAELDEASAKTRKEVKPEGSKDPAEEAKLKIEKLQKQLQKVEKRAAKAAAEVSKLKAEASRYKGVNQVNVPSPESTQVEVKPETPMPKEGMESAADAVPLKEENLERLGNVDGQTLLSGTVEAVAAEGDTESSLKPPDPLTPTSQPSILRLAEVDQDRDAARVAAFPIEEVSGPSRDDLGCMNNLANPPPPPPESMAVGSSISVSNSSGSSIPSLNESEDETTSSDESTSSSSSSSAPESQPSRRVQPDKVAPPKRSKKKAICRNFLQHGRCKKGDACGFRHELPNRANHADRNNRGATQPSSGEQKRRRIGLYQRVSEP